MEKNRSQVTLQGCLIVLVGALYCLFQIFLQATPAFMVEELISDLSLTRAQAGFLGSSLLYSYVLMQVPAGWLVEWWGVRRSFLAGVALLCLGSVMAARATGIELAIAGRLITGVGSSAAIVGSFCLLNNWFPRSWFALGVGFIEMFAMLGGALCGLITPGMVAKFGWRETMNITVVIGFTLLAVVALVVYDRPFGAVDKARDKGRPIQGGAMSMFSSLNFWMSAFFGLCIFGMVNVFGMMWGVPYLQCLYPDSSGFAAKGVSLFFVGVALGTVASGWLVSLWGSLRNCMISGALTALLLLLAILYLPVNLMMMAVLLFLFGLTLGCYGLAFVSSKRTLGASSLGVAMAFINACMLFSGQILQPLLGHILDSRAFHANSLTLADYQFVFTPLVLMAGFAVIASLFLKEARECTL